MSVSISGKYPDPTTTAFTVRATFSGPIAGSDQLKPTVFSAYVAEALTSPQSVSFPPAVPSASVNVCLNVGSKWL